MEIVNRYIYIVFIFIFLMSVGVHAQVDADTARFTSDTLVNVQSKTAEQVSDSLSQKPSKLDPMKAVWMGAILPGYGQILNKKYWKLPIVYGGFVGCAYAISLNSDQYKTYRSAYLDIIDTDPKTNRFMDVLPKGYTIESIGGIASYTKVLKTTEENYRRYRDLSIIVSVAFYALTLVDAYVDAQLSDFDISPSLSLHLQPTLIENRFTMSNTLGLQCSLNLK